MLLTFVTFGTKTGKFSGLSNISKTFSTGAPTSTDFVIFGIDVPPRDPAASRKIGVSLFGISSVSGGRYIQVSCPRFFHRSRSVRTNLAGDPWLTLRPASGERELDAGDAGQLAQVPF